MRHRLRAGFIHLCLSAAIAALVFVPIYFIWYPDVLYESAGGRDLFLLIVSVDVTLGPLITTVVYVPGKWGLKFDLVVIGTLQLMALAYGVSVLFESRPVNIVFVKDRFELVRANQVPESVLAQAHMDRYRDLSWTGPKLVGVQFPADADERFKLMVSGMAGVDIQAYPQYHVPYDAVRKDVVAKAAPLAGLARFNKGIDVAAVAKGVDRVEGDVKFLPLRAGKVDLTVLLDAKNGDVLRLAAVKPWEFE